ncbi:MULTISPECIES: protein kinase domain-containing protein [Streptacidiphilus]|uniref:PQQ-binding-like beta-propeller repeat protein n=1 Tax=Streptacidiphilus cavernicola TaxID=3342716 RepID=A0ABV6UXL3_9ACTN|nr:serine/threonine-protein kinase [Streptacidiphilus jeojiense]
MQPLESDDPAAIGAYRLIARLGAGGMGRVYLARSGGGRTVAVKVVRPELAESADFRSRFRREVEAAQSVSGAYTAPVVDYDHDAATPWLATAYVLGPSLAEAVDAHGPLPERSVAVLGAVLAEALQAIHGSGLVHRDLKPSNVLLSADGPRVIDFGIARALDGGALTSTGVVVGSPGFMSPEQASGRAVSPASDIFSLGSVLAFAATGHGPFGSDSVASLLYRVVHEAPDLDDLPPSLREPVGACLAKEPAERITPAELSRLLAPAGTPTLLRTAWLPAEVASDIASHAARVMDMEAPEAGPADSGTVLLGPATGASPDTAVLGRTPPPAPGPAPLRTTAVAPATPGRRRVLTGALSVGAVAVVGGGVALALTRGSGGSGPTPGPTHSPTATTASRSAGPTTAAPSYATHAPGVAPAPVWVYKGSSLAEVPVVPYHGTLLVSGANLTAIDARGGKQQWQGPELGSAFASPPIGIGAGVVVSVGYTATNEPALIATDPTTGAERWHLLEPAALAFTSVLAVDDKRAYLLGSKYPLDANGKAVITIGDPTTKAVIAVDLQTRKVAWTQMRKASADDQVTGSVAGKYLVYTNDQNNIVVRDTTTGVQLWSKDFGLKNFQSQVDPLIVGGDLYVGGPQLLGFTVADGKQVLSAKDSSGGSFGVPAIAEGVLYAADLRGDRVVALNAATGSQQWECVVPDGPFTSTLVVVGPTLFTGSFVGGNGVYAIDRKNGKILWNYRTTSNDKDWWLATDGTLLYGVVGDEVHALPPV